MKKTLYIVTLEPIEKRYTKQWYNSWRKGFSKNFNVEYIDGKYKGDKIKKGRFLDINLTNMYKAQQVEKIAKLFSDEKIKDNDIFLFMDGWHFGITAVKYMAQLGDIKTKMYAYWHAGTYDPADFVAQAGLGKWASYNEYGWFRACDGHFVATKFHKRIIKSYFGNDFQSNKLHVVGFPMDWKKEITKEIGNKKVQKEDLVVFPHRVDKEKRPDLFDKIAKENNEYKFIKTINVTKNKKEYYKLVKKAKISFSASEQETFGIGTVEALILDCIPLVPNKLSYVELYDSIFRYSNLFDARQKLKYFMKNFNKESVQKRIKKNKQKIIKLSENCFDKMSKIMLK